MVKDFGEHTVSMNVAANNAGCDFSKAIEEGVTKCDVQLVVIGLEWLNTQDECGARRLNDPSTFRTHRNSFRPEARYPCYSGAGARHQDAVR
jgi:hypothetical protein